MSSFFAAFAAVAAVLLGFLAQPAQGFFCNTTNATQLSSVTQLFGRSIVDPNCPAAFDCAVEFCSCVNGQFSTTCGGFTASIAQVEICTISRVRCMLLAGLGLTGSPQSADENTTLCADWHRRMEDTYYTFYSVKEARNTSVLESSCLSDTCAFMAQSNATVTSSLNFSLFCNFSEDVAPLPIPRNLTPPVVVVNSTINNTAVQLRFSGSQWGTIIQSRPSELNTVLAQMIAAASGVSASSVKILRVYEGSLIVEFQLVNRAQDASTNAALSQQLNALLNVSTLQTLYIQNGGTESISLLSVSVVVTPSTSSTVRCGVGCIIAATIGGFAGLAVIAAIIVIVASCCVNNANRSSSSSRKGGGRQVQFAAGHEPTAISVAAASSEDVSRADNIFESAEVVLPPPSNYYWSPETAQHPIPVSSNMVVPHHRPQPKQHHHHSSAPAAAAVSGDDNASPHLPPHYEIIPQEERIPPVVAVSQEQAVVPTYLLEECEDDDDNFIEPNRSRNTTARHLRSQQHHHRSTAKQGAPQPSARIELHTAQRSEGLTTTRQSGGSAVNTTEVVCASRGPTAPGVSGGGGSPGRQQKNGVSPARRGGQSSERVRDSPKRARTNNNASPTPTRAQGHGGHHANPPREPGGIQPSSGTRHVAVTQNVLPDRTAAATGAPGSSSSGWWSNLPDDDDDGQQASNARTTSSSRRRSNQSTPIQRRTSPSPASKLVRSASGTATYL